MAVSREIEALLADAVASGVAPGIVAAATTADGTVIEAAAGRRGLASDAPMTADTVFWIASMTKALTSLAAMQLVEQGRIGLDDPVGDVMPELASLQVLEGFDADGEPRLRPAAGPITLRHLLTHTSGFAEDVWSTAIGRYIVARGIPSGSTRTLASLALPLLFEPGTAWHYGVSHDLAGLVIERLTGEPLDRVMDTHVFRPLGMTDTCWDLPAEKTPRLAGVSLRGGDGSLAPFVRPMPAAREYIPGGGSLHSTAADYLAFIRVVLNGGIHEGNRLIGADTLKLMAQNHTGEIAVGTLAPTMPTMSNAATIMDGVPRCWGLGFQINLEPLPTGRSAGSLAWAGLGNTWFWIDPKAGVGGVLMTQILPFCDPAVMDLFARFERAVYDATA